MHILCNCLIFSCLADSNQYNVICNKHFLQRPPRRRRRYNKQAEDEEIKPGSGEEGQLEENQEPKLAGETTESNEQQN